MPQLYYNFSNVSLSISDTDSIISPVYDTFRVDKIKNPACFITCEEIPFDPDSYDPVFSNIQGLSVYMEGNTEYRVFRNFYTGEIETAFQDDQENRKLHVLSDDPIDELSLINAIGLEKIMSEHGKFILHSSYIQTNKGAVLFTAPSGTGKSTQADLWNRFRGAEIINGDRSGIWKEGTSWMTGGVPWCGTSGIMKNETMPLRAIVLLKQGSVNEICPIRFSVKAARILEQLTINPWNRQMLQSAMELSFGLCQEVPVIHLSCLPDIGAVELLERELERIEDEQ